MKSERGRTGAAWGRRRAAVALSAGAAVIAGAIGGCAGTHEATTAPAVVTASRKPLPTYKEAAEKYNARVLPLDRVIARATIRLTYTDAEGERRTEQPDGTLQVVRPSKLAIDLGKAGKKLFWLGCDDERYWWIDLSNPDDRVAYVGRHDRWDEHRRGGGRSLGIGVRPLDLIAAVGVTPIDPTLAGVTQWSRDGQSLGIVSPLTGASAGVPGRRGLRRAWVDPATMAPRSVEFFDADKKLVLRAQMEGIERVQITRTGVPGSVGERPAIPARLTVEDAESGAEVRVTLSDAKDGPISDKAFRLDELVRRLGVARVVDLDRSGGASAEGDAAE